MIIRNANITDTMKWLESKEEYINNKGPVFYDITSYPYIFYGNARVFNRAGKTEDYFSLEDWEVSLPINENTDLNTLVECFIYLIDQFERNKKEEMDKNFFTGEYKKYRDYDAIRVYATDKWRFLFTLDDKNKNVVRMVRTAKLLPYYEICDDSEDED